MLLRKAGYTGGVYREQYEGKVSESFPVVGIVLYWGHSRWKSSCNLRALFRRKKLEEETWRFIDDIKLHVFEMRYLPEETRKLFQSDMRIVADFLAEGESYRSDRKIVHKAALLKMLRVLSGERDTDDIESWLESRQITEEDEITVCELFDQYERKGIECGRASQLVADIENAMKFFHITLEKACEGLGTTVSRYEEARRLI